MTAPGSRTARRTTLRYVALLATLLWSAMTVAGPVLTPHSALYAVKISVLGGQLTTDAVAGASNQDDTILEQAVFGLISPWITH